MAQYTVIFDSVAGEQEWKLNLSEDEALSEIFDPLMNEYRRKGGSPLRGDGPIQVIHKNRLLRMDQPFAAQQVVVGDTIRLTCYYRNG